MNTISDITLLSDIMSLPITTLKEICTDQNLDSSGYKIDLVQKINSLFRSHRKSEILAKCEDELLAGRTSITWYRLNKGINIADVQSYIKDKFHFNPFEKVVTPNKEDLTSTPILISGSEGAIKDSIFLRYLYKSGVKPEIYGNSIDTSSRISVITVLFDSKASLLEIRGDQRKAEDIAKGFAQTIGQNISLEQVTAPFDVDVEKIAKSLNGELIDVTAKPELLIKEFTPQQNKAVIQVLNGLDEYFSTGDIDALGDSLQVANSSFNNHLTVPFSALILNGMEKVGMGSDSEIAKYPLFNYLNPNLEHQGGFIRFKFTEEGVEKKYTIRIGMKTNSIFFTTPATENVIDFVKKSVIL